MVRPRVAARLVCDDPVGPRGELAPRAVEGLVALGVPGIDALFRLAGMPRVIRPRLSGGRFRAGRARAPTGRLLSGGADAHLTYAFVGSRSAGLAVPGGALAGYARPIFAGPRGPSIARAVASAEQVHSVARGEGGGSRQVAVTNGYCEQQRHQEQCRGLDPGRPVGPRVLEHASLLAPQFIQTVCFYLHRVCLSNRPTDPQEAF